MKCPNCDSTLLLENRYKNSIEKDERLDTTRLYLTMCCGKPIVLQKHVTFTASKYVGNRV